MQRMGDQPILCIFIFGLTPNKSFAASMKKPVFITIICLAFAGLIVSILFILSKKPSNQRNNFKRLLRHSTLLDEGKVLDIGYNSYYIAGLSENQVYLGNHSAPNHLLITSYAVSDTQHVALDIPTDHKLAWKTIKVAIDSPSIFILEGVTPVVYHATMPLLQYTHSILSNRAFSNAVPITSTSIITRTIDPELKQNVLKKEWMDSRFRKDVTHVLDKQVDGVFCTDGMLLYNRDHMQLIYVYYRRNQFIGLDTALNTLYNGNTIDTVSQAKIKISKILSENRAVLTSPHSSVVNKHSAVDKSWLFIHSGLIADNEQKEAFERNSVIDVYTLGDQHYQFSFYLPEYAEEKFYDFAVRDNRVVALYDQYLVVYKLNPKHFNEDNKEKLVTYH